MVAQFFEAICTEIFEYLLAVRSDLGGFLGLVSTYFETIETNGRERFHLYYLVWLQGTFHISKICDQLCFDLTYNERIVEFIDNIIRYSIAFTL